MIKKYLLKTFVFVVISLFSIPNFSFAQNKAYIVGVDNISYFPHYVHENNEYRGFAREVLGAFAKRRGYTFIYKARPVARLFKEYLEQGKFDFKYPDNSYWQSDMKKSKKVVYSQPVVEYIDGVMVLPERKGRGVEHLKRLGTIRAFTPWTYLDLIKAGKVKISENSDFIPLIKMTLMKRVDGAYINVAIAHYQLENVLHKSNALVFDPDLPHTRSFYHLSSIKYPEIIEEFDRFLIQERNLIDGLKEKFGVGVGIK